MAIGKFQPQNHFFHYGTSFDTFWLAGPDYLKRHKNNIGALIKLLPDDIHRIPELKEAMSLTDYAVLSRYPGDLEPVTEKDYKKEPLNVDLLNSWTPEPGSCELWVIISCVL